ncbi:hypothetical protein ACCF70_000678 [Vibrio parahaemolyticus]|uniref:helix-turn-helix transcriptional regulator n=1 Tax=Vibrio parahaemolyticus TaxID=670 RepID=UPI00111FA375|nr:hypothetical protein [Vibrio parahaemolyticus]EGR1391772.1 hypothetical protein [Vibrio parahaemolyticus]EJY0897394.1 hypothetical protein [Vibrio parahaemolyticus]ELA7345056.1 hypothetical protein [Vibrio parahaemolyticus]MBE3938718.1 hypothetical protein [Vibrio parahaemolyticus]TOF05464.1 hypothetical protein CGJ29_19930 [Vibrio parahaemolyticus]
MKSTNPSTLLTAAQACHKLCISHSTLRRYVNRGLLPNGIKLNAKTRVWLEHELDQIISARINDITEEEQIKLVLNLLDERKRYAHKSEPSLATQELVRPHE